MKTKDITFIAVGVALFVVLSMCLRVPVFENYYLCLGYIVMTVYIWCFQWYEGAIIGFLGVILYCIVGGLGLNGMPGCGRSCFQLVYHPARQTSQEGRERTRWSHR